MPFTTDVPTFLIIPFYLDQAVKWRVRLMANLSMPHGTVMGELLARKGVWGPYDPAATDGRQQARGVLEADCSTDASGNITEASLVSGQGPLGVTPVQVTTVFVTGSFATLDLIGLDSLAVEQLGKLVQGSVDNGILLLP